MRSTHEPEALISRARGGCRESVGALLELYRNYLRIVADAQIGRKLGTRIDASDVVQETFLDALRDFQQFQGQTEGELVAWLRAILSRNFLDELKRNTAGIRDVRKQASLQSLLDRSGDTVHQALRSNASSPSQRAHRRESAVLVADALATLPPDYRAVVSLRNLQHLKFDEIAVRMDRSATACRLLWMRALRKLKEILGEMQS